MDPTTLHSIVGSLGFPIVACGAMAYYIYRMNVQHLKQIEELNQRHYEEMKTMIEAVNNNTTAVKELSALIRRGQDEDG